MMSKEIVAFTPQPVWQWFSDICAIPHPTFYEQALRDFIIKKAEEKGLSVKRDEIGNILIQKNGTAGMENRARVAIQAHIDMVAQKTVESTHQFETDPIQLRIVDGWLFATDTTLGADNGIGAAMALAIVFSEDIPHPPLDIILTVEEEIGMGGARALSPEWLTAPYLINLDSEDEGALFIGCAGGRDATFSLPFITSMTQGNAYRVQVSGLRGGHSGIDIHTGRANANLVLARVLDVLYHHQPFQLADIKGGTLRNVITREAYADIICQGELPDTLIQTLEATLKAELGDIEPHLQLSVVKNNTVTEACSVADTAKMIRLIRTIPNGVLRMSTDFKGIVETSISMGVVAVENQSLTIHCLMRSLLETPKDDISQRLQALADLAGATVEISDDYPGWKPDPSSPLLAKCQTLFTNFYGKAPTIEVIHAGLECGILKGHAPKMDMISFGPNIRSAHSPNECVEIASVDKCWQVFCQLLKEGF
ncbi:aminoacyl-histidine dipeptidase [Pelistega ratti]|nr:aminoacyl-histidine dipeptidase [Pelistega ratti]